MSYLDKRKKDKAFGRFIKSAKKQMKDWNASTESASPADGLQAPLIGMLQIFISAMIGENLELEKALVTKPNPE